MKSESNAKLWWCAVLGVLAACGSSREEGADANASGAGRSGGAGGSAGNGAAGGTAPERGGTAGMAAAGSAGRAATAGDSSAGGSTAGGNSNVGGEGAAISTQAGMGGVPAVDGVPGLDSFTRFTLRSPNSVLTGPDGECSYLDPSSSETPYEGKWSFDKASRTFTWDFCDDSLKMLQQGSAVLSDHEVYGLLNPLSFVQPNHEGACIADGAYFELDLETSGMTTTYRSNSGWCGTIDSDENPVSGLLPLYGWADVLARNVVLPAAPAKLAISSGKVLVPAPDPECSYPTPRTYELAVATRTLTYRDIAVVDAATGELEYCDERSRVLEQGELESVLGAYGALELGVSAACESLERPESLNHEKGYVAHLRIDDDLRVFDETASCYTGSTGAYAIGLAELARSVEELAR